MVGDHGYGTGDQDLAAVTLDALRTRGLSLAVAESCTGGLVGERVTRIPGSSDVFLGGVIAYANQLKEGLLQVRPDTLATSGAVSEACVREMATGVCQTTGAEVGVAVTGVAGPSGGTQEKPVGTVWFGFQVNGSQDAVRVIFPGARREIQARAAQFALHGVLRRVRLVGPTS